MKSSCNVNFRKTKVVPERYDHDQNFFSFCYLLIRAKSNRAFEFFIVARSGSKVAQKWLEPPELISSYDAGVWLQPQSSFRFIKGR